MTVVTAYFIDYSFGMSEIKKLFEENIRDVRQSAEFLPMCSGEVSEIVRPLMPISQDESKLMKYAAVALENGGCEELREAVKADVDRFVGEAPQFDDMTMLSLKIRALGEKKGNPNMTELKIAATVDNIPAVTAFVDAELEKLDCPLKAQTQIDIAIDELFGNIANYAYNPKVGPATVRVEVQSDPLSVVITFINNGVPYDPLSRADPDVTLSAEEREIGGLGIFLVKKTMDDVAYEYKDGQNILRIRKELN